MVLARQPSELGLDTTIVFFSDSDRFEYRKPDGPIDISSGVICCPNNFQFDQPLPEGMIRITNMANFDRWNGLSEHEYRAQKEACLKSALEAAVKVVPDFRKDIVSTDMFTPKTIHRYTGHLNGAVYGSPRKIRDGRTHLENLFICGTDQGFLGIVGALLSGISMANLHLLRD
jgi:phytoene dehydrogenase-like protein